MTEEKRLALKEATETVIAKAAEDKSKFENCAIDWGNLECTDVESVHSLKSVEVEYRVYIEKADPGSRVFSDYVNEELCTMGYDDVDVCLQW